MTSYLLKVHLPIPSHRGLGFNVWIREWVNILADPQTIFLLFALKALYNYSIYSPHTGYFYNPEHTPTVLHVFTATLI